MKFIIAALFLTSAYATDTPAAGGETAAVVKQGTIGAGGYCQSDKTDQGCADGLRCAKQDGKQHCVDETLCAGTTNHSFLDCSAMKLATGVTMTVAMLMSI